MFIDRNILVRICATTLRLREIPLLYREPLIFPVHLASLQKTLLPFATLGCHHTPLYTTSANYKDWLRLLVKRATRSLHCHSKPTLLPLLPLLLFLAVQNKTKHTTVAAVVDALTLRVFKGYYNLFLSGTYYSYYVRTTK